MRIRIGVKLMAGFALVILLMVALSLYLTSISQKSLRQAVGKSSIFLAEEMLKRINRSIYHKIEELQIFSKNTLVQEMLSESNREFEKLDDIKETIIQEDRKWVSAPKNQTTQFMQDLISNKLSNNIRRQITLFYQNKYGYNVFEEIFITNRFGANIAQTIKTTDYRQDDEEWWQIARATGFYVSDVEYDESAGAHGNAIAVRIDDETGNFIGILKAILSVKEVIRETELTTKKYESTSITLTTKDGLLIYRTGVFKFLEKWSNKNLFEIIKNKRGFFTAKDGGIEKLFSFAHSKGSRELGGLEWILVMEHDIEEVLKPAFVLRNAMIVASLILIILSIIIALLISRSITAPLAILSKSVEIIGKGDLKHRVDLKVKDEIGELGLVFNQMTARRQVAEEALREREEEYRVLIKNLPSIVYRGYKDWSVEFIDNKIELLTGYDADEFNSRKMRWSDIILKEDIEAVRESFIQALKTDMSYVREYRIKSKAGNIYWLQERGQIICDNKGEIEFVSGVFFDITNQKLAEKLIRENEERYRTLVENIDLGIILVDTDHTIVMTNAAQCRFFNKPVGYFNGKKCFREFEKREAVCPHCPGVRAMITRCPEEVETEGVRDDGSRIPVKIRAFPVLRENGQASGFIEVVEDITEKKKAAEEREKLQAHLHQAQKIQSIGTLAGGIAHDFNNVLYSIIGYTELAMDDVPEGSLAQKNLKEVLKGAMRAKDMVKQILTFSRKADTEKKPIKIQSIVKEALKLLRTSIPSTIDIRQDIDTDCGPVLADSTQIHQVVMNLATNAYQAMREKGGVLELILMEEEIRSDDSESYLDLHPGTYLKLTVSDTGHGMDNVVMEKIFEPYFSTKGPGEGTGMGLAVVHGIVKSHGGDIEVYSKLGEGTTFSVYLPLIETRPVEPKIISAEPAPTGTERILFVDDEEPIVFMAHQVLERLGYQVTPRTSSVEALEAFRAKPDEFDLVITDMTMPNMTGLELAPRLREIRPDIPIIICTGFSEMIDGDKAKSMGILGYVMKPITKEEIARIIRQVLDEEMGK